jgi:hypothetical protein
VETGYSRWDRSFNSSVVQLKESSNKGDIVLDTLFQFQCGTIKSTVGRMIKSAAGGFNSSVVQLKAYLIEV